MIEDVTLHAFDEIVNPILICELDGRLLYKNPEATRKLRKPIKGGKLQDHLALDYRNLFADGAKKESFPAIVEIEADGDLFAAFADVIYYERRPVLLLVVSHLFLYELSVPFFTMPPALLSKQISAEKLSRLITNVYNSDLIVEASRNRAYHRRMTDVFYKMVDCLLTELAFGKDRVYFPLAYTIDILRYTCDKVLSHLGLDLLFTLTCEDSATMLVDFKTFTLLAANFILFAAEISDSHIIRATVEEDEDNGVILSFQFTVKKPNTMIPMGGAGGFSELLPARSVDLFFFDQILKSGKYRFDFTLNQKSEDNLRLRLHAPIHHRFRVHERDPFTLEEALRLIDKLAVLFDVEDK